MNSKTVVVIPTYNEAESITKIATQILRLHPKFNILVVDDNSSDGTGKIVEELSNKSNGYMFQIELLTRCLRLGYS